MLGCVGVEEFVLRPYHALFQPIWPNRQITTTVASTFLSMLGDFSSILLKMWVSLLFNLHPIFFDLLHFYYFFSLPVVSFRLCPRVSRLLCDLCPFDHAACRSFALLESWFVEPTAGTSQCSTLTVVGLFITFIITFVVMNNLFSSFSIPLSSIFIYFNLLRFHFTLS